MRSLRRASASLAVMATLAGAGAREARAQASSTAKVSAETLFEEGRRLVADGKAVEACPKFAESQRLDPSPGTLLNLASCYEKTDRPATAWATYREGASASAAAGRQDLLATAQRHADALFPTLPRVTLNVASPIDGMTVALDGVSVGHAEWGVAVPVDPGEHTVEAKAPGFNPWSTKATIGKEAQTTAISVPALERAPEAPTPPSPVAATAAAPPPVTPAPETASPGSGQRIAGIVVGAAGIVGIGVGVGFAVNAKSTYNSSLADCEPNAPNLCTPNGVSQRNDALSSGNVATVAIAIGAVAAVGGVVLWLTAPHAKKAEVSLAVLPTLGGAALRGEW